jgi:hypothetical protein
MDGCCGKCDSNMKELMYGCVNAGRVHHHVYVRRGSYNGAMKVYWGS